MVDYDPTSPAVIADPYPIYRSLRDHDPVHFCEALGGWVLTRYAHVKEALQDRRLSSDRPRQFMEGLPPPIRARVRDVGDLLAGFMNFSDPPSHTRLRTLVNTAFTPRAVARLRGQVQAIIDELWAPIDARGELDLIADLAYPLPIAVIGQMLGVPRVDNPRLKVWSDELSLLIGGALGARDKLGRAERSMREMAEYFRAHLAARRTQRHDDLLGDLLAAEERGDALTSDELVATAILLLGAGHETTTNLIGNGVYALCRHPDAFARLRAEPGLVERAVEELLRFDGPVAAVSRIAVEPIEIEGTRIAPGQVVYCLLNAANRDARQFAEPDRLDLERADNRHLAFGFGIHFCIGAPLARLEMRLLLETMLRRTRELVATGDGVEWSDSLVFRGIRRLPLAFANATAGS
jgi:cytochrome P450